MNELIFTLLFPEKARQMKQLRDKLINVVLFPHRPENRSYMEKLKRDYRLARRRGLGEAFVQEPQPRPGIN